MTQYLNRLTKGPSALSETDVAKAVEIKRVAQHWLSEQLKEKGIDPDSLIFDVDVRDLIPLDQDHMCVVLAVRPKGFQHIPIKGKPYDKGHVTLITRETKEGQMVWTDHFVDVLCQELLDPTKWSSEQSLRRSMEKKKTCVILMAGYLASGGKANREQTMCLGEECAQYDSCVRAGVIEAAASKTE